jgi:hypothetical protein
LTTERRDAILQGDPEQRGQSGACLKEVKAMRRGTLTHERVSVHEEIESTETRTEPTCVHHWIIDSPAGASSMGVCKVCGERREFQNYSGDFIWEGGSTESYGQTSWKSPVTELVRPKGADGDDLSSPDQAVGEAIAF